MVSFSTDRQRGRGRVFRLADRRGLSLPSWGALHCLFPSVASWQRRRQDQEEKERRAEEEEDERQRDADQGAEAAGQWKKKKKKRRGRCSSSSSSSLLLRQINSEEVGAEGRLSVTRKADRQALRPEERHLSVGIETVVRACVKAFQMTDHNFISYAQRSGVDSEGKGSGGERRRNERQKEERRSPQRKRTEEEEEDGERRESVSLAWQILSLFFALSFRSKCLDALTERERERGSGRGVFLLLRSSSRYVRA